MKRGERERLLRDKCVQRWQIPFSNRTRLLCSTILGRVRLYRQGGGKLESLSTLWAGITPAQGTAHCVSDYPHQRNGVPTLDLARRDPQGAHRLPLPASAEAVGQAGRPTYRPQALRGRAA
ncbi:hypothetical protein DFAR_3170023 [Desulfarculales bacterium]